MEAHGTIQGFELMNVVLGARLPGHPFSKPADRPTVR